jgi:hypothetical protein
VPNPTAKLETKRMVNKRRPVLPAEQLTVMLVMAAASELLHHSSMLGFD